jgi:O-methyltransferase involved in polyketide biosynthesis/acyl-coenzyme A thioesterase PaaI-like protein
MLTLTSAPHNPPYAARLSDENWQIVIPICGRLAPLVWNANFVSRQVAEEWLGSEAGRRYVESVQERRRLPEQPPIVEQTDSIPDVSSSSYYKPLSESPDAEDLEVHARNCNVDLVTERLGDLVPLLKFVDFKVERMTAEKTVLTVPLLETAMNQNGTHQAAVFYLLADYTLGVGMFAVLPGCYTVGVHDRCRAMPVQFWLKSGAVEHRAPATGAIRAEVSLSPAKARALREQLLAKGRCEIRDTVNIYQGDQLVAVANHEMGLYADLPRIAGIRPSMVQRRRLKTSALMIAGLRGDSLSAALAQDQGIAIARRMTRASPQLRTLVAARSKHLRDYLLADDGCHFQVIVLGVGLDPKPVEFASRMQKWFICDLSDMLHERKERLARAGKEERHCIAIPLDLRMEGWDRKIIEAGFDPTKSSLVILEGVSMYLAAAELRRMLYKIEALCGHPESCLWLDHVTKELLSMDSPPVRSFLSAMARLGEPFITGFADPMRIAGPDWRVAGHTNAADVSNIHDEIHREYRFALLSPN